MSMETWLQKRETEQVAGRVEQEGADMVNQPAHYQGDGIECIDAIRAALGQEGFVAYCRGNAIKYAWRAGKKHGDVWEDMSKAAVYAGWAAREGK